jgi:hypothetical protein
MALASCPECGKTVSDRAVSCPHCGCEFEDDRPIRRSSRGGVVVQKRGCVGQTAFGCAAVVGALMVLGCMGMLLSPRSAQNAAPDATAPVAAQRSEDPETLERGDSVTLFIEGNTNLFLATTDDSWNEMLDAQNAKTNALLIRLIRQGKVAMVANGEKATIVKTGFGSMYVMTDDGIEGWIQREFVKKARTTPPVIANPSSASNTPPPIQDDPPRAADKVEKTDAESPGPGPPKESLYDVMKPELDRKEAEREAEFKAFNAKAAKDREGKAASLVKSGKNLEKLGKTKAALEFYRRAVKDYPGTAAAKNAGDEIKRLDGK